MVLLLVGGLFEKLESGSADQSDKVSTVNSKEKFSVTSAAPAIQVLATSTVCFLLESTGNPGVKMSRFGLASAENTAQTCHHAAAALLTRCVASDDDGDAAGGGTLRCSLQMVPAT